MRLIHVVCLFVYRHCLRDFTRGRSHGHLTCWRPAAGAGGSPLVLTVCHVGCNPCRPPRCLLAVLGNLRGGSRWEGSARGAVLLVGALVSCRMSLSMSFLWRASGQVGALGKALVGTGTIQGATWPLLKLFGGACPRSLGRVLPATLCQSRWPSSERVLDSCSCGGLLLGWVIPLS